MRPGDFKPYVGPRAFQREEKDLFFGRPREIRDLSWLIIAHALVLLYAASGVGKSSLLNAGVIPVLEQEHGCEVLSPARVSGSLPAAFSEAEVENIYAFNVLSSWSEEPVDPRDLTHTDILRFLAGRPHRLDESGEPLLRVIIVDQFEELFTFAPERWREREGLVRQLSAALEADPLLRAVLAMREEFVGAFEAFAPLLPHGARTRFHLEPLGPKAAIRAVEDPLGLTDRKIEPKASRQLVDELLKIRVKGSRGQVIEAVGPYVEPVQLQVSCLKLWDDLPIDVKIITPDHVKTFGDVNEALQRFYEEALSAAASKTGTAIDKLRIWVDGCLSQPGEPAAWCTGARKAQASGRKRSPTPPSTSLSRST